MRVAQLFVSAVVAALYVSVAAASSSSPGFISPRRSALTFVLHSPDGSCKHAVDGPL